MSKLLRGSSLLALIAAGCIKDQDRSPFDPREFQQDERRTAGEVPPRAKQPLPTTLQSPYIPATGPAATRPAPVPATGPVIGVEPTVRLTLREVIQRAVANNLEVKVEGYSPAIEETRVVEAEARFDPTFFVNAQYENRDDPNGESDSFVETLQEDRSQKTDEHQRDYYSMSQKREVLFDERILYNMCGRVGGGECDRDDEAGRNKSQECKNEHFPFPT